MSYTLIVFYLLAAVLLGSALRVVTARNPVHAVLFLVLSFVTAAALWMLIEAEFLGIALVLVYVGAVMVLFLFVVMMVDQQQDGLRRGFWSYLPLAISVGAAIAVEMVLVLINSKSQLAYAALQPRTGSNVKELGMLIYTEYVYPFELAAVLLLVAIIAAIALTLRKRKDSKYIDPGLQVRANKADRLRVVHMDFESGPQEQTAPSVKE